MRWDVVAYFAMGLAIGVLGGIPLGFYMGTGINPFTATEDVGTK